MKERIIEFLRSENKSSAQMADEIGVQPSGISHILSGRNNPSLDFVLKMLEKYKYLSSDWLLFGKGKMYKEGRDQLLFETDIQDSSYSDDSIDFQEANLKKSVQATSPEPVQGTPRVNKIVWFFNDNSFIEYFPGK